MQKESLHVAKRQCPTIQDGKHGARISTEVLVLRAFSSSPNTQNFETGSLLKKHPCL
jgi:hypothetical protein